MDFITIVVLVFLIAIVLLIWKPESNLNQVKIIGVPSGYSLLNAENLLEKKIGSANAITLIDYLYNSDGTENKSVVVVRFKSAEYAKKLLTDGSIEIEFGDSLHKLLFKNSDIENSSSLNNNDKDDSLQTLSKHNPSSFKSTDGDVFDACENESEDSNSSECTLLPFDHMTDCDGDVIEVILKSTTVRNELCDWFADIAQLELGNSEPDRLDRVNWVMSFIPLSTEKTNTLKQDAFENDCKRKLTEFLQRFNSRSCQLNKKKLNEIRQTFSWTAEKCFVEVVITDKDICPAFVRWNVSNKSKVTGLAHHVTAIVEWLKHCCDCNNDKEVYSENDFQLLLECDVIGDVKKQFYGKVVIRVDSELKVLTFKGPSECIEPAKLETKKILQEKCPEVIVSVTIPKTSSTVSVVKGNIKTFKSDAIVDASAFEFGFAQGYLSSKQKVESRKRMTTLSLVEKHISLEPSVGLPCTVVINVNAPRPNEISAFWSPDCLADIVVVCLQLCDKNGLKSISIPALNCDVFGASRSASLMVEAVVKHLLSNPASCIKTVNFISFKSMKVLEEFKQELTKSERSGNSWSFMKNWVNQWYWGKSPSFQKTSTCSHGTHANSPSATVLSGSISSLPVDVIVRYTTPGNFSSPNLASLSAKSILIPAGSRLKLRCQQLASSSSLRSGDVLETPGYDVPSKKIYHVLLNQYGTDSAGDAKFPYAIQTCLRMAERDGYSRIAFSAIFDEIDYPVDLVTFWFKEQINEFNAVNLKNVDILIPPGDLTSLKIFSDAFSNSATPLPALPALPVVSVYPGDLSVSNCDVIISPTNPSFNMKSGPLSRMLVEKGGLSLVDECSVYPLYSDANFRITSGGKLHCKKIVHVAVHGQTTKLSVVLAKVLTHIDDVLNLSSVAIPAIGTGNTGMSSDLVVQDMQTAFQNFKATHPKHIKKINVIIYDPTLLSKFTSVLSTSSSNTKRPSLQHQLSASGDCLRKKVKSKIPAEDQSDGYTSVNLLSMEEKNISEAWSLISTHIKEKSMQKVKPFDQENFGSEEEEEIMALEEKHSVLIRRRVGNSTQLVISGIKDNVWECHATVSEIMQEHKEAGAFAEKVRWTYSLSKPQSAKNFSPRSSLKIEAAYKRDSNSCLCIQSLVDGSSKEFVVDLSSMTATSEDTKYKISRNEKFFGKRKFADEGFPSTWEDMDTELWKKFTVAPNSDEYQRIISIFNATGSIAKVEKLKRIQNPTLYKQFQAQKEKVTSRMQEKRSRLPVTKHLFHGTTHEVCKSIYKDGFDRSHCGKNATRYGKGVYFATSCRYSQSYATRDWKGNSRIFLVEVITGEYHQGNSSLKTPDFIDESKGERYDSVVDCLENPNMYVVFKDASVYPAYILTYRLVDS